MRRASVLLLWAGLGCQNAPAPTEPSLLPADTAAPATPEPFVALQGTRLLRRVSLDLRGTLPSLAEYHRVEANPKALGTITDEYLESPAFEERLVMLLGERWHTQVDTFAGINYYDFHLEPADEYPFERAAGQEPLRLMARVAAEDRPWTDVVTTDTTMVNEWLSDIYPIEGYPAGGSGWHEVTWTDARPAAGVLTTNGLWWRYSTTNFNQNRARAASMVKLLLCRDLLARPVSFVGADELLDAEDTSEMVRSVPTCLACHSTIEPLAATLYGFELLHTASAAEQVTYHPEREALGPLELQVEPSYFGVPVTGLGDLGLLMAEDPRFSQCTVQSMLEGLYRRPAAVEDWALREQLRVDFESSGSQLKHLIRGILATPEYRAGGLNAHASAEDEEQVMTVRLITATRLGTMLEALTGFYWVERNVNYFDEDWHGFRLIAGGVDGEFLLQPQRDASLTWAYAVERAAQAAADHATTTELLGDQAGAGLFDGASVGLASEDPAWASAVEDMHLRTLGTRPTQAWLSDAQALYDTVLADPDRQSDADAWTAIAIVLMRDPSFVVY